MQPVATFPAPQSSLGLRQGAEAEQPFTVAGECGALLGQQNGQFEAWVYPVKVLSHMRIEARVDGYDVPIDVNEHAAEIVVHPESTTITYSHIAFTLRQTMFATQCGAPSPDSAHTGVTAAFQVDSVRPVTLTFSFTPEVKPMWPALVSGDVDPEWVPLAAPAPGADANTLPGWYMLHTDWPDLAAAVAMPGTLPGILAPYQERPKIYPLQLVLRFDPKHDRGRTYPLTVAVGQSKAAASKTSLREAVLAANAGATQAYEQTAAYYHRFSETHTTAETPDSAFNADFRWAEIAIDQLRVRHGSETGLVAGLYSSGASARPGFGWFFGRDALFTLYAIDSYGDFPLSREELLFLIRRQRGDGKMPHEYSQTADLVDWAATPYEYAAADSTPLFLMAMEDYVNASNDLAFLKEQWPAVEKAWTFESTHDSDGDGIYDNSQGTGWVESWPPGMPHQEIYLAALDGQASGAMQRLSSRLGKTDLAQAAGARAQAIRAKIPSEYSRPNGMYAFSFNGKEGVDTTATIYPAIAWWDGHNSLPKPEQMFERWASAEFSTDWGARDVGNDEPLYDPISYHQGSVWPLFTSWVSVAEYRTNRALSGYAHLMETANLTTAQDLGAVTELLSGDFFVPFGRSTSHQLWSSAAVLTPAMRGLFGVSIDAPENTVTVDPHLPAQWDEATLRNVHVGDALVDLKYQREAALLVVRMQQKSGDAMLKMKSTADGARVSADGREVRLPLPIVETNLNYGASDALPLPGALTAQMKVLSESYGAHSLILLLEAQGGSTQALYLRINGVHRGVKVEGGTIGEGRLTVQFPAGDGYQRKQVHISW